MNPKLNRKVVIAKMANSNLTQLKQHFESHQILIIEKVISTHTYAITLRPSQIIAFWNGSGLRELNALINSTTFCSY